VYETPERRIYDSKEPSSLITSGDDPVARVKASARPTAAHPSPGCPAIRHFPQMVGKILNWIILRELLDDDDDTRRCGCFPHRVYDNENQRE
jgi:hypothetical protein